MSEEKHLEDYYIIKNGKKLRYGYTTGSCSAAAAKAAAIMLFAGSKISEVKLLTPKGITLILDVENVEISEEKVSCAVRKDAGDDPDVTDGIYVYAAVEKMKSADIVIDGGAGIGRVTRPGLDQPVGAAAINRVPREMIYQSVEEVCDWYDYEGGLSVLISIPEGIETAKQTFNPNLGIEGGISVLGTTGIVVPMSEEALIKSIEAETKMRVAEGSEYLLVTPGNYGADYVKDHFTSGFQESIKCSNFVGETIDMAVNEGVKGILFVAHIGKFIKVAAGIMNTHSRNADGRAEIMAANALRAGADAETARTILDTVTTEEALGILKESGLLETTMHGILDKIEYYLNKRACGRMKTGAVIFSNKYGYLGETQDAEEVMKYVR